MGERTKEFLKGQGWLADGIKIVMTIIVSTIVSSVTATWTVRGILDDHDARIKVNTAQIAELKENIVPRRESELQWKSQTEALGSLREDVRDIRSDVKTLMRK